jgi:tRNA (mo5U34)-methyltransferase
MTEPKVQIAARDPGYDEHIRQLADQVNARLRYHSIELPDGNVLPGLQSIEHLHRRFDLFALPQDLRGKRVLDIGAWDGWFSFESERRGATVVAVDCIALDTFLEAKQLIGSSVEYVTLDVNELSARRLGRFDIVLFFGVLYHLRHPLLGLEKVVELSTDLALIESFVIPPESRQVPSVMEFYERAELGMQIDNWCGPTADCLLSMCRSAGFASVELRDITNQRASLVCRRRWPEPATEPAENTPQLRAVTNNRTYVATFHPLKDEYLCCYFKSSERGLTVDSVFVEVDGFGTHALVVKENEEGGYQANCLRPPGLEPGPHEVRLRTPRSGRSNAFVFIMLDELGRELAGGWAASLPTLPTEPPVLCSAEYRSSSDLRSTVNPGGSLVCYFRSPAQSVTPRDVIIDVAGSIVRADTIGSLGDGVWQANLLLEHPLLAGSTVRIRLEEGEWSKVSTVENRATPLDSH